MSGQTTGRVLRIGVLNGGTVLEERVMRTPGPVTIGTADGNVLFLPISFLPSTAQVFNHVNGKYVLQFTDAMDGFVSVGEQVQDFATLKSQGIAKKSGDIYTVPISEDARGKIVVNDFTLLFQFVAMPPEADKIAFQQAMRSWLKTVDWLLMTMWAGSFVFHALLAAVAFTAEIPPPPPPTEAAMRYSKFLAEKKKKEKVAEKKAGEGDEAAKAAAEAAKKAAAEKAAKEKATKKVELTADQKAAAAAARKIAIRNKVADAGILKVLGSAGGGGAVGDVFSGGGVTGLGGAFEGASGAGGVAGAGGLGDTMARGSGSGTATGIGTLASGGGGSATLGAKQATQVKGAVQASAVEEVDGSLDPKQIVEAIKRRIAGIKQCYESQLKKSPTLAGKIVVTFTIDETGKVSEAKIDSNTMGDANVADCVLQLIRRIRFPKPDNGTVQASYPFVFSPAG